MSMAPVKRAQSEGAQPLLISNEAARGVIAWSSLFFVLLQSVCTFFAALDGLRLLIGVGALASVVGAGQRWDRFHADWIRVPMVIFALAGALLNLTILLQVRHLRSRPAAQWRLQPLTPRKVRRERLQLILSMVTLALIVTEEVAHLRSFHHM
jgi:fumarate reductase subunit C